MFGRIPHAWVSFRGVGVQHFRRLTFLGVFSTLWMTLRRTCSVATVQRRSPPNVEGICVQPQPVGRRARTE